MLFMYLIICFPVDVNFWLLLLRYFESLAVKDSKFVLSFFFFIIIIIMLW